MKQRRSILICVVFALTGLTFRAGAQGTSGTDEKLEVEKQPAIEAKGLLKPFREVRLASRSQGVIRQIVEEGTEVKEGDPVVSLEDEREVLQVKQQEQVLTMREFEGKASKTLDNSGAISRIEGMEKAINFEVAKLLLEGAKDEVTRRKVVAPFSGVITERMRGVGEAVDEFVPVVTLVDLSRLYFEVYLPADRIRDIVEGQPAEITIDTFPERTFPGTVALISPVVNAASSEFKVKIQIDNADRVLRAGLSGACRIFTRQTNRAANP